MKTYVEFIRTSDKTPEGVSTIMPVDDRDLAKLEIPRSTDIFYFYDSAIISKDPANTAHRQENRSKLYIVAARLLTREEAKELLAPNLSDRDRARISWDPRLEQNELFALTRSNNIEVVTPRHIVIDARKNQLHPLTPAVAPKLREKFNPALITGTKPMKPVRFKPQGPRF